MALAISILTISTIAFLISAFTHNFAYGTFFATLLHVVHYMIFGAGYILPTSQIIVNYFWATAVAAIAGWILAMMLKLPALLNGAYYMQVFNEQFAEKKGASRESAMERFQTFGKFLLVVVIIAGGHVIYELNVAGFPKWAGGLILLALDIIAWVVFYFLFRPQEDERTVMFNTSEPRQEVSTITFNMIITTAVLMFVPYWIFQWVDCPSWSDNSPNVYLGGECGTFYGDQWYYYVNLISSGAVIIWSIIVGIYARSIDDKGNYERMSTGSPYRPMKVSP
jgi:hypothetical protein